MRLPALILVLILGAFSQEAAAEKVKSNQETKLFARPGERAKVIAKVTTGKMMTVLAKEGRWLKVRVSGRTGYVARSTVDLPDEDEIARNTRRRSFVDGRGTKRGFGGQEGPDDRIGADAVGEGREDGEDSKPKKGSDDDEEDDEEDEPVAKKPAAKTPPAKTPAKTPPPKKGSDDDEEDDEDPIAKPGSKPAAKEPAKTPPKKVAAKEDDEDEDEDEDEDTRKRIKIARKTTMYNEADAKSEAILVATKDTELFPTGEKKGKFTEVENDEGDLGYILTADIEGTTGGGGGGGGGKGEPKDDIEEDDEPAPKRGGSQIDLRVRAGVTLVSQGMRTPMGTETLPDNYNVSTSAVTVALGGGYYKPIGKKLVGGAELTYDYANAFGGIPTPPATAGGPKTTTKIAMHNLNVRGVLGLDFKKPSGMMLLGRVGVRYHSFQVANATSMEKNTARLPSEIITSPTIGAALAMPSLTKSIGLRFSLDFIPLNISYQQTKNLEDGKSPSAKGAIVGAGLTYRWKPSLDIQATYDLTYSKSSFGDKVMTSMRMHPGGGVSRTDLFHAVTVGIVKAF